LRCNRTQISPVRCFGKRLDQTKERAHPLALRGKADALKLDLLRTLSDHMKNLSRNFHFLLHSAHLVEERLRKRLAQLNVQPRQARILDAIGRMGKTS
jgi:hypothetical protein